MPAASEDTIKKMVSYATQMNSANSMRDTLRIVQGYLAASPEVFDADLFAFNVLNGTIDLRTGDLRPPRRQDLITKLAPVMYIPDAECPLWLQALDTIFAGNQALIDYLQRWFGYCLTGDIREHVMSVAWGEGSNGKSTILNTIRAIMGNYAMQAPPGFFTAKQNDAHPTELADLQGRRLVVTTETESGGKLPESKVKALTGGEPVRAHRMCRDNVEFNSTAKFVLVTNHRPAVRGMDDGIWRRMLLLAFNVKIPDDKKDLNLLEKLKAEYPGILAWCVRGCLEWQRIGLAPPDEVRMATAAYRAEEDILADFFTACCIVEPAACVGATELLAAYQRYTGDLKTSAKAFGDLLTARGYRNNRGTRDPYKGRKVWTGLRLPTERDTVSRFVADCCNVQEGVRDNLEVVLAAYKLATGDAAMNAMKLADVLCDLGYQVDHEAKVCHGIRHRVASG